MVVDAFIIDRETRMLETRLSYLSDVVDLFVACEADQTFSGKKRDWLIYPSNNWRFSRTYKDLELRGKESLYVHRHQFTEPKDASPWHREAAQRCALLEGINLACQLFRGRNLENDDTVMLSDIDEIPRITAVEDMVDMLDRDPELVISCLTDMYIYDARTKRVDMNWVGTKAVTGTFFNQRKRTVQDLREWDGDSVRVLTNAGWHLTYFGGTKAIRRKIRNFSHTELALSDYTDENRIKFRMDRGIDPFDRPKKIVRSEYFEDDLPLVIREFWGKA